MAPRIAPLTEILRLNTRLFRNCLEGVTDEKAATRPSASTNSAAFVAAHVAQSRFYLLTRLGTDQRNPIAAYLEGARGIDDVKRFPPLDEIQRAWTAASHALRDRLDRMTAAELDAPLASPFPLPVSNPTALSLLTFFVQHESYHIGQLALLRKHAGLMILRRTVLTSAAIILGMFGPLLAQEPVQRHTYVLVHGAWGAGWDWRPVSDILTSRGHRRGLSAGCWAD